METELAGRVRTLLHGPHVSEEKMFGGICFFWDGNMIVAASKRGLLVRVGKERHDAALKKRHTRPMIQGKRSVPGYIHVADDGTRRDVELHRRLSERVGVRGEEKHRYGHRMRRISPARSRRE